MIGIEDIARLTRVPDWHQFRLGVRRGSVNVQVAAGGAGLRSKAALEILESPLVVVVTGITSRTLASNIDVGVTAAAITGAATAVRNTDWQSIDDPQVGMRNLGGVQLVTDNTAGAYSMNGGFLCSVGAANPEGFAAILPMMFIRKVVGTPIFLTIQSGADNVLMDLTVSVLTLRKLRDTDTREGLEAYMQPIIGEAPPVVPSALLQRFGFRR